MLPPYPTLMEPSPGQVCWAKRAAPERGWRYQTRKIGDVPAGKRCWRKRRPACNGLDTAPGEKLERYRKRKRAHFQRVCNGGKSLNGILLVRAGRASQMDS